MRLVEYRGVTLVGGGGASAADLRLARARAPVVIAADGGADAALAAGITPASVIGDLDSLSAAARRTLDPATVIEVAEQDSTDFEKCLSRIAAPLLIGVGFLGRRADHQLSAFNALVRHDPPCLLLGDDDVVAHLPAGRELALELDTGTRLSLFPLRPVTGRSRGLAWPIDGIGFAPGGRIGTSNRVSGPVRLRMETAGMLLLLPRAALDAALAALVPAWDAAPRDARDR